MFVTITYPEGNGTAYTEFRYPGGEVQVRLTEKQVEILRSKHVHSVHVTARIQNGEVMALAQLIDAVKSVTDKPVKLILPYLPYSRADRRFVPGDCFGLATFGRLLGMMVDDVVTLDAHSDKASAYIRHLVNVSPKPILESVVDQLDGNLAYGTPVLDIAPLFPDEGAAKRYDIPGALYATKKRDPETGKLLGFTIPPRKDFRCDGVLIVDDICDGGGTFTGIADEMKNYGLPLYLYVTHGIFSKGLNELEKRFETIFTTDSFQFQSSYSQQSLESGKLVVIPCMGTILDQVVDRPALWTNGVGCAGFRGPSHMGPIGQRSVE